MRILFVSDLDNTLLHSYVHKKEGDICIEYKGQKEQGYITKYVNDNFADAIKNIIFVPVTSRSIAQVKRIGFFDKYAKYIIASNGGRLLVDGQEDEKWSSETSLIVNQYKNDFDKLTDKSAKESECFKTAKIIDESYYFLLTNEGFDTKQIFNNYQKETSLFGIVYKKKIYFTPKGIDKGIAVKKLKEMVKADLVIAAGDSCLDFAMLNAADIAIVPNEELKSQIKTKTVYVNNSESRFCDYVVKKIIELTREFA